MAHSNRIRSIIADNINNNTGSKISGNKLQEVLLAMVPNIYPEDTTSTLIQFVGDASEEVDTGYTKVVFAPNTNYYFTVSGGVTDIKFNTSVFTNDEAMETNVFFTSPSTTATTVTLPEGARYIGLFQFDTDTQYLLSIRNGIISAAPIMVASTSTDTVTTLSSQSDGE